MAKMRRYNAASPPGVLEFNFRVDVRPVWEMVAASAAFVVAAGEMLREWFGIVDPERANKRRRRRLGLGNGAPAIWQTDMCASWLHDDCESLSLCRCRCHA